MALYRALQFYFLADRLAMEGAAPTQRRNISSCWPFVRLLISRITFGGGIRKRATMMIISPVRADDEIRGENKWSLYFFLCYFYETLLTYVSVRKTRFTAECKDSVRLAATGTAPCTRTCILPDFQFRDYFAQRPSRSRHSAVIILCSSLRPPPPTMCQVPSTTRRSSKDGKENFFRSSQENKLWKATYVRTYARGGQHTADVFQNFQKENFDFPKITTGKYRPELKLTLSLAGWMDRVS